MFEFLLQLAVEDQFEEMVNFINEVPDGTALHELSYTWDGNEGPGILHAKVVTPSGMLIQVAIDPDGERDVVEMSML